MKSSISSLQIIVLISVLSAATLFGVVSSLYNGYHTQIADAKRSSSGSEYTTLDNTLDTTNSAASSQIQQQQQPPIPGAIQLSAKELPSGYRWVNSANGVINPTMIFNVGTSKTIQLQNPTDAIHQLVIDDPNGNQLATSGNIASGSSSQLSFNPDVTGIFGYHCIYHPTTMKGTIQVQ
jgi:heme/copper-type cytochrome/quinol oxidase subunit 2